MSSFAVNPNTKYSYADYKTWDDNERWEIINGVVYNMSPAPMRIHQKISGTVFRKIGNYLEGKSCQVYDAPFDVRFIDYENQADDEIEIIVQPDIVIVCDENKLDDYGCKGSPDIIIEIISPSTFKRDKIEKFYLYEKYEVKEYWIVFPCEKIVEIYKLTKGKYEIPEIYGKDDKIVVKYLDDFILDLKEVF